MQTQVEALDWTEASEESLRHISSETDVIIAADVVYDPSVVPALVRVLSILLEHGDGSRALIAATIRNPLTLQTFLDSLSNAALQVVETTHLLEVPELFQVENREAVMLYLVTRKPSCCNQNEKLT